MPAHVYTIVARGVSLDVFSNNLTLFGLVREFGVESGLPARLPELNIVTLWERAPEEDGVGFTQRTRFVAPDGSLLGHQDSSFTFGNFGQHILGTVVNLPLAQSGRYVFEVLIRREDQQDWSKPVATYPIYIRVSTPSVEDPLLESQKPAEEAGA